MSTLSRHFFPKKSFFSLSRKILISLPDWIYFKKGIVNPRCSEKDSFKFSLMMQLFPEEKHTERVSKRMKQEALNFEFSDSSTPEEQISFFEEKNDAFVSVLTNGPGKTIIPWRIPWGKKEKHFVLFLFSDRFFCVRNLSRLFHQKGKRKVLVCKFCLEVKVGKKKICGCPSLFVS